mgnify:CR=1 FL=1
MWLRIMSVDAIAAGSCCVVQAGARRLAIARVGELFFALENTCPHAGGSLGEGYVSRATLHCPQHDWPFDLTTGKSEMGDCVATFPTRVAGGWVEVDVTVS